MYFCPLHAVCFLGCLFQLDKESATFPPAPEYLVLSASFHLFGGGSCSHPPACICSVVISPVCSFAWPRAPPLVFLWEVAVLYLPLGTVPFVGAVLGGKRARLAGIPCVDAVEQGPRETEASVSRTATRYHTLPACRLKLCLQVVL